MTPLGIKVLYLAEARREGEEQSTRGEEDVIGSRTGIRARNFSEESSYPLQPHHRKCPRDSLTLFENDKSTSVGMPTSTISNTSSLFISRSAPHLSSELERTYLKI